MFSNNDTSVPQGLYFHSKLPTNGGRTRDPAAARVIFLSLSLAESERHYYTPCPRPKTSRKSKFAVVGGVTGNGRLARCVGWPLAVHATRKMRVVPVARSAAAVALAKTERMTLPCGRNKLRPSRADCPLPYQILTQPLPSLADLSAASTNCMVRRPSRAWGKSQFLPPRSAAQNSR